MFARSLNHCLLAAAFCLFPAAVKAIESDTITGKHIRLIKTEKLDSGNNAKSLATLIDSNPSFTTQEGNGYNLAVGRTITWLKVTIQNTDTLERTAVVELTNPFLYLVKFFTVDSLSIKDSSITGSSFPYDQRSLRHPNFQYSIAVPPLKKIQCYIQVQPGTVPGDFTLIVWEKEARGEYQLKETRYLSYFFLINVVFLLSIGLAIQQTRLQYQWYYFCMRCSAFFLFMQTSD